MAARRAAFTDDEVRGLAGYDPLPDGAGESVPKSPAPPPPPPAEEAPKGLDSHASIDARTLKP